MPRDHSPWSAIRLLVPLLLLFFLHVGFFIRGMGGDGWGYYAVTESIAEDGDLDLTNNYYGVRNGYRFDEESQRWLTQYPPGSGLFDLPFFLLSEPVANRVSFVPDFGERGASAPYDRVDGGRLVNLLAVICGHALYTALALILTFSILARLGFSDRLSAGVVALCFVGGPLHFYAQNGYPHAASTFLVALAVLGVLTGLEHAPSRRRLVGIGLLLGLGALVRYENIIYGLPFAAGIAVSGAARGERALRSLIRSGLLLGLGMALVLWVLPFYWKSQGGSGLQPGYANRFTLDVSPWPPLNTLISTHHGFLLYHPLFLLALFGWTAAAVRWRSLSPVWRGLLIVSLGSFFLKAFFCGFWKAWWSGEAYSQRFLIDAFAFLAPGLACFLHEGRRVLRAGLGSATALFSYVLFALANAGLVYDKDPGGPGDTIKDYRYLWEEGLGLGDTLRAIAGSSHTWPVLREHPFLLGAVVLAAAALLLAPFAERMWRAGRRPGAPAGGREGPG